MSTQQRHLGLSGFRTIYVKGVWTVLLIGLAAISPRLVVAQSAEQRDDAVRVGDRWVYDTKDEETGFPKDTVTTIVTEVSANEIITSASLRGKPGSVLIVYDKDWNTVDGPPWKYKPNNGMGVRLPLAVGKDWRTEYEAKNTQTGINVKGSSLSKVLAKESVTTGAGTFDTFKIERNIRELNTADPSQLWETKVVFWYTPEVNHWVRRTFLQKYQQRVRANTSEELADFSRNF